MIVITWKGHYMNKKNKFMLLSCLTLATYLPIVAISCTQENKFIDKNIYTLEFNESNPDYGKTIKNAGVFADRNSLHDSLTGNYLLRWQYDGSATYSTLNKYFKTVSVKALKFGFINSITLNIAGTQHVYDTDEYDKKIKNDLLSGYKKYIYVASSKNIKSINHESFLVNLSKADSISFGFDTKQHYYDNNASKTNILASTNDLLNSIKKANMTKNQLDSLDIIGLNPESILNKNNYKNDSIVYKLNSSKSVDMLLNVLINNKMFSLLHDSKDSDNLFIGSYSLNQNNIGYKIYILNKKSIKNVDDRVQKVIFKYNQGGKIDEETNKIHLENAYKQGLITSQDISVFNKNQQDMFINNSKEYKKSYKINVTETQNIQSIGNTIIWNSNPVANSKEYNDIFAKLLYGSDYLKNVDYSNFYSGDGFIFRNNITNLINKFALSYNILKSQYYDNSIDPNAIISNSNNSTNYNNIASAYDHIVKEKIYVANTSESFEYYFDENEISYWSDKSFADINEQFKAYEFDKIKNSIIKILDKFYLNNSIDKSQKIKFSLPVLIEENNENIEKTFKIAQDIINSVDPRIEMKFELKNITNFKSDLFVFADYKAKNTVEYIQKLLEDHNNSLLIKLFYYDNSLNLSQLKHFKDFIFKALKITQPVETDLKSLINNNKIKEFYNKILEIKNVSDFNVLAQQQALNYHVKNDYYAIIKLINDIKNYYAATYRFDQIINLNIFSYEIIQPWVDKPTRDDSLVYFEDIKIK